MRPWFVLIVAVVAAASLPAAPHVVLIVTDDQDLSTLHAMPHVRRLLTREGVTLENFFATTPLCCPSRVSILRGQYAHNHEVWGNLNCYARANELEDETVAVWMKRAGYRTALFGKYWNHYIRLNASHVPPGWDEWHALTNMFYYGAAFSENGNFVRYGPEHYQTDLIRNKVVRYLDAHLGGDESLFLYVAPHAPHEPADPAHRHAHLFPDAQTPRVPSWNTSDAVQSQKPVWIRGLPPLNQMSVEDMDNFTRNRLRSLVAVDELVRDVVQTLERHGALETTYVVFTSDHGFHLGTYRLLIGKRMPYETDIRAPFIVRGPGIPRNVRRSAVGLNIDLAPTLVEMSGTTSRDVLPDWVDGVSLLPTLRDGRTTRHEFVVEGRYKGGEYYIDKNATFTALRSHSTDIDSLHVEWYDGSWESYDLKHDPWQLHNLQQPSKRLSELAGCRGVDCR